MARKKKRAEESVAMTDEEKLAKKKAKRRRALKGWIIALAIIALIAIVIGIIVAVGKFTPHENYYGNGTIWNEGDNFDDYYAKMESITIDLSENRPLKIMQISDPQLKFGSFTSDKKTFDLLGKALEQLKPDIAIVTGDLTYSIFAKSAVKYFADFMEEQKVYWAFTYGNHDSETTFSKYRHSQLLAKYEYCLFDGGPANIKGESNYFVNVKSSNGDLLYSLCMMDSNMYQENQTDLFHREYGEIEQNQVDWYKWNIEGLKTKNPNIQSSLFIHIPFKKYLDVYNSGKYVGSIQELPRQVNGVELPGIAFQGAGGGESMYQAIVDLNSTKGVFCGHDHVNTMRGATADGILLAYGRATGYHTYPFFDSQGDSPFLESIVAKFWGFEGASMYMDEWHDENGNDLGKGVSIIEIDVNPNSTTYGAITMFDVDHNDLNNNTVVKQHLYSSEEN